MSIQERKLLISLLSTFLIFGLYSLYVHQNAPFGVPDPDSPYRFWGSFILILIPVTIAAKIVIAIVFSILHKIATNEEEPRFADELDRLIGLKASRNSYYVFVLGFVLAMAALVLDMSPATMFVILVGSGFMAEVTDYVSQLYYYRKGV